MILNYIFVKYKKNYRQMERLRGEGTPVSVKPASSKVGVTAA